MTVWCVHLLLLLNEKLEMRQTDWTPTRGNQASLNNNKTTDETFQYYSENLVFLALLLLHSVKSLNRRQFHPILVSEEVVFVIECIVFNILQIRLVWVIWAREGCLLRTHHNDLKQKAQTNICDQNISNNLIIQFHIYDTSV